MRQGCVGKADHGTDVLVRFVDFLPQTGLEQVKQGRVAGAGYARVVLEVVAEARGGNQAVGDGDIRTGVQGGVRSRIAEGVRVRRRSDKLARAGQAGARSRASGHGVEVALHRVGSGQRLTVFTLSLGQPGTEYANALRDFSVEARIAVHRVCVLTEWNHSTIRSVIQKLFVCVEFRVERHEKEQTISETMREGIGNDLRKQIKKWSPEGQTGENIARLGSNRLIVLVGWIDRTPTRCNSA